MKVLRLIIIGILLFACSFDKPVAVEIKDVCSQSEWTNVTIQGYLSLPEMLEVTKFTQKKR